MSTVRPLKTLVREWSVTSKETVNAYKRRGILLIIHPVPPGLWKGNSLINFPAQLKYLMLVLVFSSFEDNNIHEWEWWSGGWTYSWEVALRFGIAMWYQLGFKWCKYLTPGTIDTCFWYVLGYQEISKWSWNYFGNSLKMLTCHFSSMICFIRMDE